MVATCDTISFMNPSHRRTLDAIFTDPISGTIPWRKVEALFRAVGCEIIEGRGSRVTIVHEGRKASFHRPHPGKDAFRYQIRAARDFLKLMGLRE
jgi:hypothetical protein